MLQFDITTIGGGISVYTRVRPYAIDFLRRVAKVCICTVNAEHSQRERERERERESMRVCV